MKLDRTFVRISRVASFLQTEAVLCSMTFFADAVFGAGRATHPTEANLRAALPGECPARSACVLC